MATVKITGLKELDAKLKSLSEKLQRKIAKEAVTKASEPILHDARANAPVETGLLVSTLVTKARKRKGGFSARVQTAQGDFKGDAFYASFIEYGAPGAGIKPEPFMRPAFDKNVQKAIQIVVDELTRGINAATK